MTPRILRRVGANPSEEHTAPVFMAELPRGHIPSMFLCNVAMHSQRSQTPQDRTMTLHDSENILMADLVTAAVGAVS